MKAAQEKSPAAQGETSTKNITLRLPANLHKEIAEEAERKGLAIKSIILDCLWNYVGGHTPQ